MRGLGGQVVRVVDNKPNTTDMSSNPDTSTLLFLDTYPRSWVFSWLASYSCLGFRPHKSGSHIIYRITAAFKVETDIITSIIESPIRRAGILVIMYVSTFKNDVIIFISIKGHNVTSCWMIFSSIRAGPLIWTIWLNKIIGKISNLQIKLNNWWRWHQ